jgi:hypothetical protein
LFIGLIRVERIAAVAGGRLLDDAQDLAFPHDEILFIVEPNFVPGILAEEDLVSDLQVHRESFAVVGQLPGTNGDDFPFLRFFFRRVGNDDSVGASLPYFSTSFELQWLSLPTGDAQLRSC